MMEGDEKFLSIFHNNLVGMILTDKDHLITDINDYLLNLAEVKREDVIGKTGVDIGILSPDFAKAMWRYLEEKGSMSNVELSYTTRSHKVITGIFSTEKTVINNELYWLTTVIDISKKKKADDKIFESEFRFRTLTSTAPVGIFETDEKGLTTYVNETWLEYTGLSFEEAMGDAWMSLIHPDDRDMEVNTWYSKTERAEISHSEYRIIDRNERLRWVNGKAVPLIDKEGRITGYIGTITDVTERKLAMESLKQSEENLNKAQQISKTGSWEFNPFTRELTWSREMYRIFELEECPKERLYEAYKSKYREEDFSQLEKTFRRSIESGEGFTYEHRITCNNAGIKYIFGIGEAIIDAQGKVSGLKGTCQDVTENKLIEQEILRSHKRMDNLINTIDGIVWEADARNFNFTFVSKKAEQILGFPVEQWIYEKDFWTSHMHPDDREWTMEYCLRATREKRKHDFEYRMIASDGSIVWLRDIVTVISEHDKPIQLRGIMVNITENKKAEEEISYNASLLENVSDAILSLDPERRIMSWNKASEQMYGYSKEEVLGRRIPEIVVFEFPGTNNEAVFKEVYEKGSWKGEINFVHPKNGRQIIVLGYINLLKNREGNITGFIATSKDITDRKHVENALNERTEQLRELSTHLQEIREEERTNIAREIHDELGQQLTGLKMDITWLKKRVKTEDPVIKNKFAESIKLIDASVKTIRRIVTELRPSIIDDLGLNAAVEWHVVDFGKKLGLHIEYENDFDDEHIKPAISIGLFRILQESLTNIAKHAQAKNVSIKIGQVNDTIHLCVKDDGVGFDTKVRQIDKTFGLLGIKERANKMDGECFIESGPGEGTKIEVRIPL
jgi:PAS domain S-box-containing protein